MFETLTPPRATGPISPGSRGAPSARIDLSGSPLRGTVRRVLGIAWMEWRLILRSALYRLSLAVCLLFAVLLVHGVIAWQPKSILGLADPGELSAEAIDLQIGLFAPTMVAFVASFSAARERRPGIPETLFTTTPASEEFVVGKFAAVVLSALLLLGLTVAASWLWLLYVEGIASPFLPFQLVVQEWWMPLTYVAGLGFAAGLAMPGAIGGAVVFAYLIAVLVAARFISPVFYPFFGFLAPAYFCFGLALVWFAGLFYQRERRGAHYEHAAILLTAGLVTLGLSGVLMARAVLSYEVPPFHHDRELWRMARLHAVAGQPLPSFQLEDVHGRIVTPERLRGAPTVYLLMTELPPPEWLFPPARALVRANERNATGRANLVLVVMTRDPYDAERWGRLISPTLTVVRQFATPRQTPAGFPALFGLQMNQLRMGVIAVTDSEGRFLGWRQVYDLFRPPALLAAFNSGNPSASGEAVTPAQTRQSENETAAAFFRSLWHYDRQHDGSR